MRWRRSDVPSVVASAGRSTAMPFQACRANLLKVTNCPETERSPPYGASRSIRQRVVIFQQVGARPLSCCAVRGRGRARVDQLRDSSHRREHRRLISGPRLTVGCGTSSVARKTSSVTPDRLSQRSPASRVVANRRCGDCHRLVRNGSANREPPERSSAPRGLVQRPRPVAVCIHLERWVRSSCSIAGAVEKAQAGPEVRCGRPHCSATAPLWPLTSRCSRPWAASSRRQERATPVRSASAAPRLAARSQPSR